MAIDDADDFYKNVCKTASEEFYGGQKLAA
ncbi:hypothetical protein J2797_005893 [Paraburkholderia terricola]|uniref:Uncharacterized protein n=1 Tax=Paraburkholderia terricola TaxID=169427 RepID=A0ABU1M1I2_9BURK|nr:hypothetical protein [Paraburkholderia terricola]MDR6495968.1 hypothetical protein [Paraburkholderia terricola]